MATNNTNSNINSELAALRLRVRGEVIVRESEGYDQAREIHNARIDRKPAVIVKVRDASDVSRVVRFARQEGLRLAVRAGGHSIPGHSMIGGGVIVDLTEMDEVRIDPEQKVAWAQPGATAGQYAEAAQAFGLATPFGDAASVGLGGITLGGGIGFLVRKHGLTIDHLLEVELVTADGQILTASKDEHPDLFWALRGGGGNFGVVTGYKYRLVEVGMVYGGLIAFPATKEVIQGWAELSHQAPEELTTIGAVMPAPPAPFVPQEAVGKLVLALFTVYSGDPADGPASMAPIRALAEPVVDMLAPMPYPAIYAFMEEATKRRRERVRSNFYREIDGEMVDKMLEYHAKSPVPGAMTQIRPLGGAMARVSAEATAFSHRGARFMVAAIDLWEDAAQDSANDSWIDEYWEAIKGKGEGVYSNFLEDEGEARLRQAYSASTFARLAEVKHRYDPANVFNSNQNIRPVARAAAA